MSALIPMVAMRAFRRCNRSLQPGDAFLVENVAEADMLIGNGDAVPASDPSDAKPRSPRWAFRLQTRGQPLPWQRNE